jgi:hypothetical protein
MADIRTLPDAVAELIHDGDTVAMEGFTHLIPFAAAHVVDLNAARVHRRPILGGLINEYSQAA